MASSASRQGRGRRVASRNEGGRAGRRAAARERRMRVILSSIEGEYQRYKGLAEGALGQVTDDELVAVPSAEGNSLAMLVWHLSGNLKSRFTDFLTSDGEKPWRDRESEFVLREVTRDEVTARWNEGWSILFSTL